MLIKTMLMLCLNVHRVSRYLKIGGVSKTTANLFIDSKVFPLKMLASRFCIVETMRVYYCAQSVKQFFPLSATTHF